MHLIAYPPLREAGKRYPALNKPIKDWYNTVKSARWTNLEEVRRNYRDAEAVGRFTVFNLKGNHYRLIVGINYQAQTVYYKYLLTHAEYDKGVWKNDPYF